jgi:hypothetical protein
MMLKGWSDGLKDKKDSGEEGRHVPLKDAWEVSSLGGSEVHSIAGETVGPGSVYQASAKGDAVSMHTAKLNKDGKAIEFSMDELLKRLNKVQKLSNKLGSHEIPTEVLKRLGTKKLPKKY